MHYKAYRLYLHKLYSFVYADIRPGQPDCQYVIYCL